MADATRTCSKCLSTLAISDFYLRDGEPISRCKACVRAAMVAKYQTDPAAAAARKRELRLSNPDSWRSANRRYYEAHREEIAAKARHYRRVTRAEAAERTRRWRSADPARAKESAERYRRAHPELVKERYDRWRAANPDLVKATRLRRKALKLSASANFTAAQLRARIDFFGGRCWMCGDAWTDLDHVKPLSKGGPHILANLRPACGPCNGRKHAKWFGPHALSVFCRQ